MARICDTCRHREANPRGWQWDYCTLPWAGRKVKPTFCGERRREDCGPEAKLWEPISNKQT